MRIPHALLALTLASASSGSLAAAADPMPGLKVHEWGTFTVLMDDHGRSLGAINVDDEPVPPFVHALGNGGVRQLWDAPNPKDVALNGGVTVRLETPVLYVHLPPDRREALALDISATWNGGWLTQFYPKADQTGWRPGLSLSATACGTLRWRVDAMPWSADAVIGPKTDLPVWVAPRRVQAAALQQRLPGAPSESERYLFYRGIGAHPTPLHLSRADDRLTVTLTSEAQRGAADGQIATITAGWLIDVRADGMTAFRRLPHLRMAPVALPNAGPLPSPAQPSPAQPSAVIDARFADADRTRDLAVLKTELHAALMADGLHADEAAGMVATWETSWLRSPGLRVLYLLPPTWTDAVLPLRIDPVPAEVRRAMVGRIELLSDDQRLALSRYARSDAKDPARKAAFRALGRFREAWIRHPSATAAAGS